MTDEQLENLLSELSDYTGDDLTITFDKLITETLSYIVRLKDEIADLKNKNAELSEKVETIRKDTAIEIYEYIDGLSKDYYQYKYDPFSKDLYDCNASITYYEIKQYIYQVYKTDSLSQKTSRK